MNRLYQTKAVHDAWDGRPFLATVVMSTIYNPPRLLYRVPLCDLEEDEYDLNAGRFVNYQPEKQVYVIRMGSGVNATDEFTRMLGWIISNTKGKWSVEVETPNATTADILVSFEDLKEALLFRLTC